METIYKTFRVDVKSVNEETGEIDMLIPMSTASIDRDGESINPLGWRKSLPAFKKRPVLLSSHDYKDLRKQIGEFTQIKVSEDGLFAKPKYYINEGNEEADWAFKLASKGVAAYSVGFIPIKWTDGDFTEEEGKAVKPHRIYEEQELLEISHVVVPSNRDAIMGMRSKSVDPVIQNLIDDIVNAPIIDLTEEPPVTKPEETMNMYRIPVPGEAGKHTDHKIRTIDIDKGKGIKALYCIDDKKNITYMFDKEKWDSMEAARAWMMEHMPKSRAVSQTEIIDEIDYLKSLIEKEGMNDITLKAIGGLVKSTWGELIKMDMGKMQEMHDMMQSCEGMAKKAKKMSEDMMADMDEEEMDEKRISGSDNDKRYNEICAELQARGVL